MADTGERRVEYWILVWKPKGKSSLGSPRYEWEDNIKTDDQDVGWSMDWIDLPLDRDRWQALVNGVNNRRVPQNVEKFLNC